MPLPEDELKKPEEAAVASIPPNFEQVTGRKPDSYAQPAVAPGTLPPQEAKTPAPGELPPLTPAAAPAAPIADKIPLPPNYADVITRGPTTEQSIVGEQVRHTMAMRDQQLEPAPDLELGDELARSLGRGAVRLLQFFPQTIKMVGADLLRSKTVESVLNPILNRMDELAQSPGLREGAKAKGTEIDLDQIMSDPNKVLGQIGENAANGYWWASKLPEQVGTFATMWGGGWIARLVGGGAKLIAAARVAEGMGDTVKAASIINQLNRISKIGTYGAAIAMEAGEAEQGLRQWELTHPDVSWGKRVMALGISGAAGAFEAMSFERVFSKLGKNFPAKVLDSIITEGSTEGIQTLIENTAKKLGYDWDQKLTEGIVEAIMIGGVMGGALGGGAHAVERYREGLRDRITRANAEQYEWETSQEYRRGAHRATTGAAIFPGTEEAMEDTAAIREMGKVEEVQDHQATDTGLGDAGSMEPGGETVAREVEKDRTPPPGPGEGPAPAGPEVTPGPQGPQTPPTMGPEGVGPEMAPEGTAPTGDINTARKMATDAVWSYDGLTPGEVQSFQDSIGQAGTHDDIESVRRQAEMTSKYRQATAAGTPYEGGREEAPPETGAAAGPALGPEPSPTEGGPATGGATITQEMGEQPAEKPPETPTDHHATIDGMNIDEEHKAAYHALIDSTDDPETKSGFTALARIVESQAPEDMDAIEKAANWIVERRKAGATDEELLAQMEQDGWPREPAKAMLHITQEQAPEGVQPEPEKAPPTPGAEGAPKAGPQAAPGAGPTVGPTPPPEEKAGPEAAPVGATAPTEGEWEHVTNADNQEHAQRLVKKLGANIKNKEYRTRQDDKGKWTVERRHVAGKAEEAPGAAAAPEAGEKPAPKAAPRPVADMTDEELKAEHAELFKRQKTTESDEDQARSSEITTERIYRKAKKEFGEAKEKGWTAGESEGLRKRYKKDWTKPINHEAIDKAWNETFGEEAGAGETGEKAPKEEKPGPAPEEKLPPKEEEKGEKEAEGEQVEDEAASIKLSKALEPLLAQAVFKHDKPLEKATVIAKAKEILNIEHKELWRHRKLIDEALELAQVNQARTIILTNENAEVSDEETLAQLTKLYNYTPTLRARDSESVNAQAYSTPAPLAFLMSRAVGLMRNSTLYEPTAGNGMLTIAADPKNVHVNEILKDRLAHLKSQGFGTVTSFDAKEQAAKAKSADVVLINSPFGSISKQEIDGFVIKKLEHLISMKALEAMADDGNAAIIIGGHSFADSMGKAQEYLTDTDRTFFNWLYSHFNVVAHINIDGKVYERMGTKFPIRLLVVHGRKAEIGGVAPATADAINQAMTFEQVHDLLKEVIANAEGEQAPMGAGVAGEQPKGEGGTKRPGGPGKGAAPGGMGGPVGGPDKGTRPGGERPGPGPGEDVGGPTGGPDVGPEGPAPAGAAGVDDSTGAVVPVAERPGGEPGGETGAAGEVPPGGPGAKPGGKAGGTEGGGTKRPGERGGRPKPAPESTGPVAGGEAGTEEKPAGEKEKPKTEKEKPKKEPKWPVTDEDKMVHKILQDFLGWFKRSGWEAHGFDSPQKFMKSLKDPENRQRFFKALWEMTRGVHGDPGSAGTAGKGPGKGGKKGPEATQEEKDFARRIYEEFEQAFGGETDWEDMKRKYQEEADQRAETDNKEAEADRIREEQEQATELQDVYETVSSQGDRIGTVAPNNMRSAMQSAVQRFEQENGPVDTFVLTKLKYSSYEELYSCLAAEQIETVALTIREIERGQAFIMGHQTGVGKGRCCAAIMRYARLEGKRPIFVTAKANLFQDMFRDMVDIKSGDFRPMLIGEDTESTILDPETEKPIHRIDAAMRRGRQAAYDARAIPPEYDGVFTTYTQFQGQMRQHVSPNGTVTVQGGPKHQFLEAAAVNNIVILDESHEAAGSDTGRAISRTQAGMSNRAAFFGQLLIRAQGVMYSSATFAKRPGAMPLYFRTAINNSGLPMAQLMARVSFLGTPGQEWLSQQLTLEGQMTRLETSYKGLTVEPRIDVTNRGRDAGRVDNVTTYLRSMIDLDDLKTRTILPYLRNFFAGGGSGVAGGQTLQAQVSSTTFTSIIHNAINQMMYSMRASATADMAVDLMTKRAWKDANGNVQHFKDGQKPFVAVFNTMDALIEYLVKEGHVKVGDQFEPDFRMVLLKNLDSLRHVNVTVPGGQKQRLKLTDDMLLAFAPEFYTQFKAMEASIKAATDLSDLSATPLDYIKREIKTRGEARFREMAKDNRVLAALAETDPEAFTDAVKEQFGEDVEDVGHYAANLIAEADEFDKRKINVGEITGRKFEVLPDENGINRLQERKGGNKNSRNTIIREFNGGGLKAGEATGRGKVDVVVVNTAGFTGMSAHASKKFKDQTPRAMVVSQLPGDINMVMQGMGRINRTGQVKPPAYYFVSSALPAETRPLMVLTKKLRSLSANVSANADTWLNLDVQDTLNDFGDEAVAQVLIDDLNVDGAWYERLDDPLDIETTDHDGVRSHDTTRLRSAAGYREQGGLMTYVTGRLALLPVEMQDEFWVELNKKYTELVEYYKLTGEYNLESQTLDLQAEIINKDLLAALNTDVSGYSALSGPAYIEEVNVKNLTKPFKQEELEEKLDIVVGAYKSQVAAKLAETQAEFNQASASHQKTEDQITAIGVEIGALDRKRYELPDQVRELNRRLVTLNQEIDRLRSVEDIKLDVDAFGDMAKQTGQQLEDAQIKLAGLLKKEGTADLSEMGALKAEREALESSIKALRDRQELYDLKAKRAGEEMEARKSKEAETTTIAKTIEEKKAELEGVSEKISAAVTQRDELRTQRRALGREVDRLESLVEELGKPYAAGVVYAEELGNQVTEDYNTWVEYMTAPRPNPNAGEEDEPAELPPLWRQNVEDRKHNAEAALRSTLSELRRNYIVGRSYQIPVGSSGESMKAVLYKITYKPGKRYNPATPANFTLHFALNNPMQQMPIYLDKVAEWHIHAARDEYLSTWDQITPQELTEVRYMVTGNLLLTPNALLEPQTNRIGRGKMTFFTRKDGSTEAGIFLPRGYTPDMVNNIPVGLTPEQLLPALVSRQVGTLRYEPKDVSVSASRSYSGEVTVHLNVPGTQAAGAPFIQNVALTSLLEDGRFRSGTFRRKKQYYARIKEHNVAAAMKILYDTHEVRFTIGRGLYNSIFGDQQQGQQGPGGAASAIRATLANSPGWKSNIAEADKNRTAKDFRALLEGEAIASYGSVKEWQGVMQEVARAIEENNPASTVSRELKNRQRIDLTGHKLDYRDAARSLAELWQVYRHPKMEILHQVFTDQNGTILAHHAMTLGLGGTVGPENIQKYLYDIKKRLAKFEAYTGGPVQVHFIHNHPAGDSTLSPADKTFATRFRHGYFNPKLGKHDYTGMEDKMGQFVVINHNNYSHLSPFGYAARVVLDPRLPDYQRNTPDHIQDVHQLSRFGHFLSYAKDKIMLVFTHADLRVTYFAPYSKNMLRKNPEQAVKDLRALVKARDGGFVYLMSEDSKLVADFMNNYIQHANQNIKWHIKNNIAHWLNDIIVIDEATNRPVSMRYEPGMPTASVWNDKILSAKERNLFQPSRTLAPAPSVDEEKLKTYAETKVAPEKSKLGLSNLPAWVQEKSSWLKKLGRQFYYQMVSNTAAYERVSREAEKNVIQGVFLPPGQLPEYAVSQYRGMRAWIHQALWGSVYHDVVEMGMITRETQELQALMDDELAAKGEVSERTMDKFRAAMARKFFTGGQTKVGAGLNDRLAGLQALEKMKGEDVWRDFWHIYMIAQRDLELSGEFGNRFPGSIKHTTPEESNAVLDILARKYGTDFPVFKDSADQVRGWADQALLQPMVTVGLLSEDVYNQIKASNQFYIPFFRLMEEMDEKGYVANNANLFEITNIPVKTIKGSERQMIDPLEALLKMAYNVGDIYGRAKVARTLAELPLFADVGPEIKRVKPKFFGVPIMLRAETDPKLRKQITDLLRTLGVDVKVKSRIRGYKSDLAKFKRSVQDEGLDGDELGYIIEMMGASERSLAHALGHALDANYGLAEKVWNNQEIRKELRKIADQRVTDTSSAHFRKWVRGKDEQIAEFVNRWINARGVARTLAPRMTKVFEDLMRDNEVNEIFAMEPSHQIGVREFEDKAWVPSAFAPEPNSLMVYIDGKRYWYKLDKDLYQASKSMTSHEVSILEKVLRAPATWLRAGSVLNPEFMTRNWVRDVIQAKMLSRYGFSMREWTKDVFRLIAKDAEAQKIWDEWEAGGGPFGTSAYGLVEAPKFHAENLRKGTLDKTWYATHPIEALRMVSGFFENVTRYSVYRQAMDKGASHAEAIHEARTVTIDFARHGAHPIARALAMMVPFYGASVQGIDRVAQAMADPEQRPVVMRRLAIGITLPSILLFLLFHDDKRLKELELWEKNYFWHIPLGKDGPIIRLPKPFELGIAFGSTIERALGWAVDNDKEGIKGVLAALMDAATPNLMPTIARPFVEGASNWNFFMGRPIEDASLANLPKELRAKPWTMETTKAASRLMANVGLPESMRISPVMMEHFIRSLGGGLTANYMLPGIDLALRKTGALKDIPPAQEDLLQRLWGVRAYVSKEPTGMRARSVGDFFKQYQEIIQADQGWKAMWNSGDIKGAEKFLREHPEAALARIARKEMNNISLLKKARNKILENETMTSEVKRTKLDQIDAQILGIAQKVNLFLSDDVAPHLRVPSRNRDGKSLDLDDYYKTIAIGSYDAYTDISRSAAALAKLGPEDRAVRIGNALTHGMSSFKLPVKPAWEVEKAFRFKDLFDTPTRAEKEKWREISGTLRGTTAGFLSGYRLKEQKEKKGGG